jgi:uncharacterized membrane protein YphA (DoxX/SURF4 family)
MRIANTSHAAFAIIMMGVGVVGILHPDLMPVWNPIPGTGSAHELLTYCGIGVSLLCGVGLLVQRTAAMAARLLLGTFLIWMLLFRLPNFFRAPLFAACWSVFPLAVMLSGAMVLYVCFNAHWDREHFRSISSINALRTARIIYGLSLIFFGAAHFIDVKDTISLIPSWIPGHLFWAYFTGCAFIGAGISVVIGVFARLAAILSAVQIALFLFLVWIPIVAAGSKLPFQWSETFLNAALMGGAWVVADSYRGTPWFFRGSSSGARSRSSSPEVQHFPVAK